LEVSIIGLRELLPYLLIPIQKPFVEFNCGGTDKIITQISTSPTSSSPNFLEVIEVAVRIPEDKLFAPPINIKVFDDRLIYKPLIGVRYLNL